MAANKVLSALQVVKLPYPRSRSLFFGINQTRAGNGTFLKSESSRSLAAKGGMSNDTVRNFSAADLDRHRDLRNDRCHAESFTIHWEQAKQKRLTAHVFQTVRSISFLIAGDNGSWPLLDSTFFCFHYTRFQRVVKLLDTLKTENPVSPCNFFRRMVS